VDENGLFNFFEMIFFATFFESGEKFTLLLTFLNLFWWKI